eukprot:scaffold527509_cov38-Prasinocladus_malaysianus.AAC.1
MSLCVPSQKHIAPKEASPLVLPSHKAISGGGMDETGSNALCASVKSAVQMTGRLCAVGGAVAALSLTSATLEDWQYVSSCPSLILPCMLQLE